MAHTVFDASKKTSHLKSLAFLDPNGGVSIQRYETMKYRQFDKLTEKQRSFFWQPQEIDVTKDGKDFKNLDPHAQHIFTANLKRQILLDSVQGRSPSIAFLPIVSLPELESFIAAWTFSESVHSLSYTHIIRNVYPDPSVVFDEMMDISEIVDCAKDISAHYDDLIEKSMWYLLLGEGKHSINGKEQIVDLYELKKALWLAIISVNILEGVRFYCSFIASWSFAERNIMEGNAKIIKLICKDENLHLAATQTLLKILPKDDQDYASIADETKDLSIKLFLEAVDQEKAWAKYLFKDGSIVGLNYQLLESYLEWLANKRMTAIGLPEQFKTGANPLPWSQKWIAGADVQVPPQEQEIVSYVTGAIKQDVQDNTFDDISL